MSHYGCAAVRCLRASYSATVAALAAFKDSTPTVALERQYTGRRHRIYIDLALLDGCQEQSLIERGYHREQ